MLFQQCKKHLLVFYSKEIVVDLLGTIGGFNEIHLTSNSYGAVKTNQTNAMKSLPVRSWRFCESLLTLKEHPVSATVIVGSNFTESPEKKT